MKASIESPRNCISNDIASPFTSQIISECVEMRGNFEDISRISKKTPHYIDLVSHIVWLHHVSKMLAAYIDCIMLAIRWYH